MYKLVQEGVPVKATSFLTSFHVTPLRLLLKAFCSLYYGSLGLYISKSTSRATRFTTNQLEVYTLSLYKSFLYNRIWNKLQQSRAKDTVQELNTAIKC